MNKMYIAVIKLIDDIVEVTLKFPIKIEGTKRTISRSNTKNRIAIKKNCDEKGIREDDFELNPHSKFVV